MHACVPSCVRARFPHIKAQMAEEVREHSAGGLVGLLQTHGCPGQPRNVDSSLRPLEEENDR
eukprot:1661823-Alexandrium_andersonii.AAC.1